jgi:hypothetical protein
MVIPAIGADPRRLRIPITHRERIILPPSNAAKAWKGGILILLLFCPGTAEDYTRRLHQTTRVRR